MSILKGNIGGLFLNCERRDFDQHDAEAWLAGCVLLLQRNSFRPLNVEAGELQALGWVKIDDLLSSEVGMVSSLLFGDMLTPVIALTMRVDTIALDQKVFKARLAKEIREWRMREGTDPHKEERMKIEDKLRMEMLRKEVPKVALYDLLWDICRGLAITTAKGGRALEAITDLVHETFGLTMRAQGPVTLASELLSDAQRHLLAEVFPANFNPDLEDFGDVHGDDEDGDLLEGGTEP